MVKLSLLVAKPSLMLLLGAKSPSDVLAKVVNGVLLIS